MLELRNIKKSFQGKIIYSDFNLRIEKGKTLAIVGPSGGGKTTLLRMLAGLEPIDSGKVLLNGAEIPLDQMEVASPLGFVFQDFQLFPHLSVMDNLTLSPIHTLGMDKDVAEGRAKVLLNQLGLAQQVNHFPHTLSGGQKQRVAFARAMMIDPEIIGYDEPTSALDPALTKEVERLILENKEQGMTQIVVTHDMEFAKNIADETLLIEPKGES